MLSKQGYGLEMDWSQLRLGYRMGVCAVLVVWVCWDCIWGVIENGKSTIGERSAFPIFRACGGILLLQWYWVCSVVVWTRYRTNYIFLFDFIPSTIFTPFDIFCAAVDNTLVFLVLMLLYYKAGAHDIPEVIPTEMYPLILVLFTICKLIFPLRQRRLMWQTIYKVVSSPLHSPTFFHTYVGDIFTSMVKDLLAGRGLIFSSRCFGTIAAAQHANERFSSNFSKGSFAAFNRMMIRNMYL